MKDIKGLEIKVGMTVRTTQQSGGIFAPAPPKEGIVVEMINCIILKIKFRWEGDDFDSYILLDGQINEIINHEKESNKSHKD